MAGLMSLLQEMSLMAAEIKAKQDKLDARKEYIKQYMKKKGREDIKSDFATVYTSTRVDITYDIDALEEALDKSLTKQFIDAEYTVDFEELKRFCLRNDIPLKRVRAFLSVKKTVNTEKLDKLYDAGKITMKDIEGCYESHESKTVGFKFK